MAEEFKEHLESFLLDLLGNIGNPELLEKYQIQYENLVDELKKNDFIPKEKTFSIILFQKMLHLMIICIMHEIIIHMILRLRMDRTIWFLWIRNIYTGV